MHITFIYINKCPRKSHLRMSLIIHWVPVHWLFLLLTRNEISLVLEPVICHCPWWLLIIITMDGLLWQDSPDPIPQPNDQRFHRLGSLQCWVKEYDIETFKQRASYQLGVTYSIGPCVKPVKPIKWTRRLITQKYVTMINFNFIIVGQKSRTRSNFPPLTNCSSFPIACTSIVMRTHNTKRELESVSQPAATIYTSPETTGA